MNINQISPRDNNFTKVLDEIAKPPKSLYFTGKLPTDRIPTIAIVGTRKPTAYGREVTERFAYELAQKGVVVISGLALGVDAIAHKAALDAGGTTLAVLANPLPDIRPMTNRSIGERILSSGGAIIAEHDTDKAYLFGKWSFLERNRLVSGLADAILITEAGSQSGTMSTAARALEQGKDVFVIPGNITSPMSLGCNILLKQGALPVTCPEDILEVIAPHLMKGQSALPLGQNELETNIIQLIQAGVRDGDAIQSQLGITATDLSVALTMLEINGIIRSLGANQWSIR